MHFFCDFCDFCGGGGGGRGTCISLPLRCCCRVRRVRRVLMCCRPSRNLASLEAKAAKAIQDCWRRRVAQSIYRYYRYVRIIVGFESAGGGGGGGGKVMTPRCSSRIKAYGRYCYSYSYDPSRAKNKTKMYLLDGGFPMVDVLLTYIHTRYYCTTIQYYCACSTVVQQYVSLATICVEKNPERFHGYVLSSNVVSTWFIVHKSISRTRAKLLWYRELIILFPRTGTRECRHMSNNLIFARLYIYRYI